MGEDHRHALLVAYVESLIKELTHNLTDVRRIVDYAKNLDGDGSIIAS